MDWQGFRPWHPAKRPPDNPYNADGESFASVYHLTDIGNAYRNSGDHHQQLDGSLFDD
jgi:hypothetical protein